MLVSTFEAEAGQGDPADGVVVLRFPSEQAIAVYGNAACVTENQPEVLVSNNGQDVIDGIPAANEFPN